MNPNSLLSLLLVLILIFSPGAAVASGEVKLTGKEQKSNHLLGATSPYLLQHACNPVDWYPWGEEALARAEEEGKPIFLSIGYSTCHWCHVMARESFEDPEIAALLNRYFISIKVDREERPDLDRIYMAAVQAMTGGGGWPMSLFLTPDGRPFYGGTYFPPEDAYGRPGFRSVIQEIVRAWREERQRIYVAAERLTDHLSIPAAGDAAGISADVGDRAVAGFMSTFDHENGGFGAAPKFPRPAALEFLLYRYLAADDQAAGRMVRDTLAAMAKGGIHDFIGGGFHRYCVDKGWQVPHFEKMLYDQAQLAALYARADLVWPDAGFSRTGESILSYVIRDLGAADGGFFAAEDADIAAHHTSKKTLCPLLL